MPSIKQSEPTTLEEAFNTGQGAGYVLDFVDRTPGIQQKELKKEID
jgi:hypothetical protein